MLDGYPTTELLNVVFNRFTEYEEELTHLRAENARLTAYDGSQPIMPFEEWQ